MTTFFHKRPSWVKFIYSLFSLCILASFSSCTEDEHDDIAISDAYIVYDSNNETEYPISVFNSKNQTISMFKTDESGYVTELDCFFAEDKSSMTISFNEDGLINGIGMNGATIAFSNYNGNKVDIAIIADGETALLKEVESSKNWDKLAQKVKLNGLPSRAKSLNFSEKEIESLKLVADLVKDQYEFVKEIRIDEKLGNSGARSLLGYMVNMIKDIGVGLYNINADKCKVLDYASFIVDLTIAVSQGSPWGILYTLVTNYDTYVDLISDLIYDFFVWKDDFFNDRDNGIGALNSGFGNLKATLSWNFYADVDLHAIEPSGTEIFWNNPKSAVSGGFLDVDNREGGSGAIENIYWSKAENGEYAIGINYYGESTLNGLSQAGTCTVSVYYNGSGKTYRIPLDVSENQVVTTISLPTGNMTRSQNSPKFKIILNNLKSRGIKK